MKLLVLPDTSETEARSQYTEILGLQSDRMGNGRFALASLSVKPEDTWGGRVRAVDPVNDFIQDIGSRSVQTLLPLDQSDPARVNQGVQAKVFVDLLHGMLAIEKCTISELLHELV